MSQFGHNVTRDYYLPLSLSIADKKLFQYQFTNSCRPNCAYERGRGKLAPSITKHNVHLPAHFRCFPSKTTSITTFVLFSVQNHNLHISFVASPLAPPQSDSCCFSITTSTTSFRLSSVHHQLILFSLLHSEVVV